MKIGIIGAGKVGCSLGIYFVSRGLTVCGYYDTDFSAAKEAAKLTKTDYTEDISALVEQCDTLFLTVPDGLISKVWDQVKQEPIQGKYVIHCSGALSAEDAFSGIADTGSFGYSVHPLFAVSDKYHSYKELKHAFFTIEGDPKHLQDVKELFRSLGNRVLSLDAKDKVRYHLAAAICSNHMIALLKETIDLMSGCGFSEEDTLEAIAPIVRANIDHVLEQGPVRSLTGPVERADLGTVQKHLTCLDEKDQTLYELLSLKLLDIAKKKNPSRDYGELEAYLEGEILS